MVGIGSSIPVYVSEYSFSTSVNAVCSWLQTLLETIEYVRFAEETGDIKLTNDSKLLIDHIDDSYYEKLLEAGDVIYKEFLKHQINNLSQLNDSPVDPDILLKKFYRNISDFKMFYSLMSNIWGETAERYQKFAGDSLLVFLNVGKYLIQKKHGCIQPLTGDESYYLSVARIKAIEADNHRLEEEILKVREVLLNLVNEAKLSAMTARILSPGLAELSGLIDRGNLTAMPAEAVGDTGKPATSGGLIGCIRDWIKNLFD